MELAKVALLRDLCLDNNIITALPTMTPFSRLQHLSLCHNAIKAVPRSIGTVMLSVLSGYALSHLIVLGDLVALETLNLAYNSLSTLPSEMSNLRQLKYLGLEGNRNLQTLSLELSRMTGTQIKVLCFHSPLSAWHCRGALSPVAQMDGLLHVPAELENPLLILEWMENLNLLGLPLNLRSHWVRIRMHLPFALC